RVRRFIYEAIQLFILFAVVTPFPLLFHTYWENVGDDYQETIGIVAIGTTVTVAGFIVGGVLLAAIVPRLFNLMLKPGRNYSLYGFHYWLQSMLELVSNVRLLNVLFGDSSAIVYYLRAIGWRLN
ncbi:MAG: hypothetical protein E5V89_33835, partial [Mesorhizobium sp.]